MGSGEEGCVPSHLVLQEYQRSVGHSKVACSDSGKCLHKGETYLIPADGWVAEQLVSRKVSLLQVG